MGGFVLAVWFILFVARGGLQRGIGGSPVHHTGLNKLERLDGPSAPSSATPYSWLALTPRFSLRAEWRYCTCLTQGACPVRQSGALFMLKFGVELVLGPKGWFRCLKYYWVIDQAEFATDLIFTSREA